MVAVGWLPVLLWPHPAAAVGGAVFIAAAATLSALDPRRGLYGRTWVRGDTGGDAVALTFDDGPHPIHTRRILDILDAEGARATFFVIGERVREHPGLVREIVERGHEVAAHSDEHRWQSLWRAEDVHADLRKNLDAIETETRQPCRLFRPPIGIVAPTTYVAAAAADCEVISWSLRSFDGRGDPPDVVQRRVASNVRAGDIVLLHDSPLHHAGSTLPSACIALPGILRALQARGLRSQRVSDLLRLPPPPTHVRRSALHREPVEWLVAASLVLLSGFAVATSFAGDAVGAPSAGPPQAGAAEGLPGGLAEATRVLGARQTVSATFVHEKFSPLFAAPQRRTGRLELRTRDRRLLWVYDDGPAVLMADGRFFPAFRDEKEAGRAGSAGFALPGGPEQARVMQGLFALDPSVLASAFTARELAPGRFELRPTDKAARALFRSVLLDVGGNPLVLQRVELAEATGDRSVLTFTSTTVDGSLPDDHFRTPAERSIQPR